MLRLEAGIPVDTRKVLIAMGWLMGDSDDGFGRYECVENLMRGNSRMYTAASEMRADGTALAF